MIHKKTANVGNGSFASFPICSSKEYKCTVICFSSVFHLFHYHLLSPTPQKKSKLYLCLH